MGSKRRIAQIFRKLYVQISFNRSVNKTTQKVKCQFDTCIRRSIATPAPSRGRERSLDEIENWKSAAETSKQTENSVAEKPEFLHSSIRDDVE